MRDTTIVQQATPTSPTIDELLTAGDTSAVRAQFADAHPADIADILERLTLAKRPLAWNYIPETVKGEVLAELTEGVFKNLAHELDKQELIDAIKVLDIDDIADLIPDMPEALLADVLFAVDVETRNNLGEVLSYPEDSAGGLMNFDATVVRDNVSLDVVLHYLRLKTELPDNTDTIYLVDREKRLKGILPINTLLTQPGHHLAIDHAIESPVSFRCLDSEQDVAKAFADYNLITAPVVDESGRLLGRITIDDVVDVIREQAEHDIMAAAGLREEEDIFAPVARTSRRRTIWLAVNLVTALLGSWVIGLFEGSIQQLVALAVLMPIVASMGGNAGTQTLTVVIRGMSVGTISSENFYNVLQKETLVGMLNGVIWATVIALIASLWYQDLQLGLVIAAAMTANLFMGAVAGVFIPILLEKVNIDPALAGGVALTTVTDVVGYFSVLGLATVILL
ncbi:magnesium transporter [Arenicella xantha]|uniref:Magnesium transporter MgtE n=1 Tax=Arenicella xantha TaxID=644221 RepID=A0A395JHT4_9GAMM|nr:magnesium transporter [Arenicella xantha]RBP49646.1 magnesium transporter [Arenicella xantha]